MIVTPLMVVFLGLVFGLLLWFFSTVDKRKWLIILVSLLITPVFYFFVFYPFVSSFTNYHHQKCFSVKAWQASPGLRYEMITNIENNASFLGKSKDIIVQLLGQPEWYGWDAGLNNHNFNKWHYGLGIKPSWYNTKKHNLIIVFANNKVIASKVYTSKIIYE